MKNELSKHVIIWPLPFNCQRYFSNDFYLCIVCTVMSIKKVDIRMLSYMDTVAIFQPSSCPFVF